MRVRSKASSPGHGVRADYSASGATTKDIQMSNETNQAVQNSSTPAPVNPATGNTNSTAVSTSGATPTATPVVARKGFRQALQEMLQGWQAAIPTGSTIPSGGGTLEQGAVLGQLQAYLGVFTTLDTQTTSLKQTRAQLESQQAEARQFYDGLKLAVTSYFGAKSPQLAQFGLAPRKARKALTSSQLAVKAAKAMATRAMRGTTGKKQKALVKAGPMAITVGPVQQAAPGSAPEGATAASTAPAVPTVNAASPPAASK
jgi:hypothetical protein